MARQGGFSRAAKALEISQPAVSIQVQDLEKHLGVPLFHRRSKGLQLTEIGETVYDYVHRIFSLSSELREAVQAIRGLKAGHLTIGASTTPGEYILPVAMGRFRRRYPDIDVELRISNTRSIISQIHQRELDIGMIGSAQEGDDALATSTYVMDEIVLVAALDHPLVTGNSVDLESVMDAGLVIREQGSATRQAAEECFFHMGVSPKVVMELGSNQAVKLAAESGVGVGVVSRFGIGAEVKAGLLKVIQAKNWECIRPLTLVYLKEKRLSPAQNAFLEILETEHPLPSMG